VRKSKGGRMVSVKVTLSDWLYRAVLSKSVLTLSSDYFRLRKPLERRIYELARKNCDRQPAWTVSVATLHKKSGSAAPLRVFRAALRKMILEAHLPDYTLREVPGDLIRFERMGKPSPTGPHLSPETLAEARTMAPGADVYALQAEWQSWWEGSGRARLSNPDRAFLGWLAKRRR
jgi:plasmid replication initiation protein